MDEINHPPLDKCDQERINHSFAESHRIIMEHIMSWFAIPKDVFEGKK